MRKKAFLITTCRLFVWLVLTLIAAFALWGAIAWANSTQTGFGKTLEEQKKIVLSYLRKGKNIADSETYDLISTYKDQPDLVMAIYQLAQAYSNNKKYQKAMELFQYAAKAYPKNIYGILSQVRYDSLNRDYDDADVVADYLIAHSHDNEDVKKGIRGLTDFYRARKEFARAVRLYESEIENWADLDNPTDPYREAIYCYIDMNDIESANSLIAQMQKELTQNPKLVRANFDIANYFLESGDSVSAFRLHEYNVNQNTDDPESLLSQAALVCYYVRAGDEENAYIEYAKMLTNYEDEETLPNAICKIGDVYLEVGNSEKARKLYQQVLDEWPESEYVFNAEAGFIKADIHDDYDEAAMLGINFLIADYNDRGDLPLTVFQFGKQYLKLGSEARFEERVKNNQDVLSEETTLYYLNAREIWNKVIYDIPESDYTGEATFMVAETHNALNELEKALSIYQSFVEKWPNYDFSWVGQDRITKIYKKSGLDESGSYKYEDLLIAAYETLIEKFPDCPAAEGAQRKLDSYRKQKEFENMNPADITAEVLKEMIGQTKKEGGSK